MIRLSVGSPYPTRIPTQQGIDLNLLDSGLELRIFMPDVDHSEATDYRQGDAWLAFYDPPEMLVCAFRFGGQPWIDASLDYCRTAQHVPHYAPKLDVKPNERLLLNVILVDTQSTLVKALRSVTLSPTATQRLLGRLSEQRNRGFGNDDSALSATMARYTTDDLVKRASFTERLGLGSTL